MDAINPNDEKTRIRLNEIAHERYGVEFRALPEFDRDRLVYMLQIERKNERDGAIEQAKSERAIRDLIDRRVVDAFQKGSWGFDFLSDLFTHVKKTMRAEFSAKAEELDKRCVMLTDQIDREAEARKADIASLREHAVSRFDATGMVIGEVDKQFSGIRQRSQADIDALREEFRVASAAVDARAVEIEVDRQLKELTPFIKGDPGEQGIGVDDLTLEHCEDEGIARLKIGNRTVGEIKGLPHECGLWKKGFYHKGAIVTYGGSAFIARCNTSEVIGGSPASPAWRLLCKRGKDA